MSLPPRLRAPFDELLRRPLEDTGQLRRRVAAFAADVEARAAAYDLDVDVEQVHAIAATLELMLKRMSRKTTPLHHRLVHATAQFCTSSEDQGRSLDDARFGDDRLVVNETARVIRRPELTLPS